MDKKDKNIKYAYEFANHVIVHKILSEHFSFEQTIALKEAIAEIILIVLKKVSENSSQDAEQDTK